MEDLLGMRRAFVVRGRRRFQKDEVLYMAARIKLPGEIWIVSRIEFRIQDADCVGKVASVCGLSSAILTLLPTPPNFFVLGQTVRAYLQILSGKI